LYLQEVPDVDYKRTGHRVHIHPVARPIIISLLHLQATHTILREDGEHGGVCVRDDAHGALGLGAHRVVVADHDPTLEAGSLLQLRRPEPKPLGEEPQQGAPHGGGVRVPLEGLVAADGRDARRVGPLGPERYPDGVSPARGGGLEQVDVGGVGDPAGHGAAVVRGALGGGELVEGAHGGERPRGVVLGDAEGLVVVDEVEEAPAAGGLGGCGGGEGRGEGEVDDGDGDARGREGRGGVGVRVHEERGDGGDAGLDEAADARAGLVEGLEERGAVGLGRRSGGRRRHGRAAEALGVGLRGVEGKALTWPGGVDGAWGGGPLARRVLILSPSSVSSSPSPANRARNRRPSRWRWAGDHRGREARTRCGRRRPEARHHAQAAS
jgi:hypothetical protein